MKAPPPNGVQLEFDFKQQAPSVAVMNLREYSVEKVGGLGEGSSL